MGSAVRARQGWRHITAGGVLALCITACGSSPTPGGPEEPPVVQPSPAAPPGLLGEVAAGGLVIFFRHAARDAEAISTGDLAEADNAGACVPGSELTGEGAADSARIGAAFARHGIQVDRVACSPTCRTTQMAHVAFGVDCEPRRELTWPGMWSDEEARTLAPELRQLLGTMPPPKTTLVLISHSSVLTAERVGVTVELGQADAAVFRPLGNGGFELLGVVPKDEWVR